MTSDKEGFTDEELKEFVVLDARVRDSISEQMRFVGFEPATNEEWEEAALVILLGVFSRIKKASVKAA